MNDQELDAKIRSLVASAVAETPVPRPLPAGEDAVVREMKKSPSRRGFVVAGLGIAASVIAVSVVWSSKDDNHRVIPATTIDTPTTEELIATWPADVSVVVASDRGVERVSAEGGEPAVSRVSGPTGIGGSPTKAYELGDGSLIVSYCCQEIAAPHIWRIQPDGTTVGIDQAGGVLQDVSSDGAVLYVEGRFNLVVSKGDVRTVVSTFSADAAVEPEFNFQSDWVVGTWDRNSQDLAPIIVLRDGRSKDAGVVLGGVANGYGRSIGGSPTQRQWGSVDIGRC